jgi:hypothetical protein
LSLLSVFPGDSQKYNGRRRLSIHPGDERGIFEAIPLAASRGERGKTNFFFIESGAVSQ